MTSVHRDPVLIVVQLTGGNDYMNTVVPYADPLYRHNRSTVGVAEEDVLPIDGQYGFNPVLAPLKELYDDGRVAVINASAIPTPTVLTSGPWTSGTPASRNGSPPRAGWAA